ncbi:hypothetical protein ACFCX4_10925 [Kitasatospora sp. NPDC056327]|uniref:hypothetical protein n=1 Tax=Kitasatospora sp. NPDC056327 TaxID=3345785 RepID=UPI0035D6C4DD
MTASRISVVIPGRKRLDTVRTVPTPLGEQTPGGSGFEVTAARARAHRGHLRAVAGSGPVGGRDVPAPDGPPDGPGRIADPRAEELFGGRTPAEVLPLVGLAPPYDEAGVAEFRRRAPVSRPGEPERGPVRRRAGRVAGEAGASVGDGLR